MKKATLLLGVVLVLMSCTKDTEDVIVPDEKAPASVEGQNTVVNPNNTWTDVMDPVTTGYSIPIVCDGVESDYLEGNVSVFCRMLWRGSGLEWMIMEFSGELRSKTSGEKFYLKDIRKYWFRTAPETFNTHISGDRGSRYIISGTVTYNPYTVTIEKAVCPPGGE